MHFKIESGVVGYILIFISCLSLVIYVCFILWKDRNETSFTAEERERSMRLRETEKRLRRKQEADSYWNQLD